MSVENLSLNERFSSLVTSFDNKEHESVILFLGSLIGNKSGEPLMNDFIIRLIGLLANKDKEFQEKIKELLIKYVKSLETDSLKVIVPILCEAIKNNTKWQLKLFSIELLQKTIKRLGKGCAEFLVDVVPILSELMWSTKNAIKKEASKTMKSVCKSIDNKDLVPFIPDLISAIKNPEEVEECVHKLAATTFVQTVDCGILAIIVPLLSRGFKERNIALTRKCAIICENMCKLVENPNDVKSFVPILLPYLERAKEEISDIECRNVCSRAYNDITNLNEQCTDTTIKFDDKLFEGIPIIIVNYFKNYFIFNRDIKKIVKVFDFLDDDGKFLEKIIKLYDLNEKDEEIIDVKEKDKLCDCTFSLAYGSRILLNNARLVIEKGERYGIVAQKSAGKTTLLKSIANYQIDGFPTAEEVKTVFVDTDVQGFKKDISVNEYCAKITGCEIEDVNRMLLSVSFTDNMLTMPITSLSGGWRMKMALCTAMLRKADILLMDEPTNHLDVLNVQWVIDYLTGESCKNVTSLLVSHDTNFLEKVATKIIHLSNLKLETFTGGLTKFVEKYPATKSYYDLRNSTLKFNFPEPGPLSGVNAKGKTVLQMQNVSFKYPSAEKEQLRNVSVRCSMASRVACVGANGAGKSTLIKILTGELEPTKGVVTKNPNLRFAYVAQHAFHHIEQHLKKTPNEYIQWRYSNGEDKEAMLKSTSKLTDEELKLVKKPIEVIFEDEDGKKIKEKRICEKIVSRRKSGKKLEYEIKWELRSQDYNTWFERDYLIDLGFIKLIEELDRRLSAIEGSYSRVLSKKNVAIHLENVGLETELSTHNRIGDLSGGQKVKVVLGACTWCQPHLIILDEPTNYLDREALGALAKAINDFEGGVVLITHNKEFADLTTRETWVVANNCCDIQGDPEWEKYAKEALELKHEEEQLDAAGNKIEKKRTSSSVNPRDKKKMMKQIKKKIKNDEDMTDFEELCAVEWNLWE